MSETKKPLGKRLKESLFGVPKKEVQVKENKVLVLGTVEQSYGIYQIPSFKDQVTVFWDDPLIKEALTMFGEQVVATGFYLTSNPDYTLKINGKTALDVIREWCDLNNLDTKLLEIAIELKAFGNSFWQITDLGFTKIPIEAVGRAVKVDSDVPLQERYNLQLVPSYFNKIIKWGEFIHFRVGVTGYHAPFGQGVIYSLLMKPRDSAGNVAPSIYDIRLSMRSSLQEGFRKFSFGNSVYSFKGMSNEDFEAKDAGGKSLGERIASMSSTGNRIATNAECRIDIEVPERTQSYDQFIKYMRDEFFMSLADPSLKLGLEEGFTKATAVTASDVYKYKIATMRRTIKQHLEDLFDQILSKMGYDPIKANVEMVFGAEEKADYDTKEIFQAEKQGIITKNEARLLLSKYNKWDITGNIEGGDVPRDALIKSPLNVKLPEEIKEDEVKRTAELTVVEKKIRNEERLAESLKLSTDLKKKKLEILDKLIKEDENMESGEQ